jgi:predicted nucleic acid-binding protein
LTSWNTISNVAERWVINASPVILLSKAEVIQFVPRICDELVIPAGVVAEVQSLRAEDPGVRWLKGEGARYVKASPPNHPALSGWRGGAGEGEVISWALQNSGFTAILDDRRARALAMQHGVHVIGSLRVVVLIKERGLIPQAKPALEKLRGEGAWVSEDLIRRSIELAGEA